MTPICTVCIYQTGQTQEAAQSIGCAKGMLSYDICLLAIQGKGREVSSMNSVNPIPCESHMHRNKHDGFHWCSIVQLDIRSKFGSTLHPLENRCPFSSPDGSSVSNTWADRLDSRQHAAHLRDCACKVATPVSSTTRPDRLHGGGRSSGSSRSRGMAHQCAVLSQSEKSETAACMLSMQPRKPKEHTLHQMLPKSLDCKWPQPDSEGQLRRGGEDLAKSIRKQKT